MSVEFETYKENPKNLDGKLSEVLEGPEMVPKYLNMNLNYDNHKLFSQDQLGLVNIKVSVTKFLYEQF